MSLSPSLPSLETTPIPGLVVVRLDRRDDSRGFFKENWQREKMLAIGLPDFGPVQNNVSFNSDRGVTRGIHTEPWDKFVSLATGRIFGAWVDMREGESFGATFTLEMDTSVAVFVPRGVGNSYQVLEDATAYTYLVNEHWRAGITYPALALDDPTVAIDWPIPLGEAIISEKDQNNPGLDPSTAIAAEEDARPRRAAASSAAPSQDAFPGCRHASTRRGDGSTLTDAAAVAAWPWHEYAVVLNAAAYTAVDVAETPEGRRRRLGGQRHRPRHPRRPRPRARVHAGPLLLGVRLRRHRRPEVTPRTSRSRRSASTPSPRPPATSPSALAPRHYLLRTSWVIGEGKNFVRTMAVLAGKGVSPPAWSPTRSAGSPSPTSCPRHPPPDRLAAPRSAPTTCPTAAPPCRGREIAREVFERSGRSAADVSDTTTAAYAAGVLGKGNPFAPRPLNSAMSLEKIRATGFEPEDALAALDRYLAG